MKTSTDPLKYDSVEEMDECRTEATIKLEKLYKKYGFVIWEITDSKRFRDKCRGSSP